MDMFNKVKDYIFLELMPYLDKNIDLNEMNLLANGLDSIKIMRLICFLEKTFKVTIPDKYERTENFATLDDIMNIVAVAKSKNT